MTPPCEYAHMYTQSPAHTKNKNMHVLHMHASCICLSSSTGTDMRKAIHGQQALLTTLAPLH